MMESDGNKQLPHAGSLQEGNPAVGSDRVKALVAGAGSKDCGGSQTSLQCVDRLAPDVTSEDKKRQLLQECVKRQGDMLHVLSEFLRSKKGNNIHKDVHSKVAALSTNWRWITELGGIAKVVDQPKMVSVADTQRTPTLVQQRQQSADGENVKSMDVEETPKVRRLAQAKRRRERRTPQSAEQKEKKRKQQEEEPRTDEPEREEASQEKWQKVRKKKGPRKKNQPKPPQQQPRQKRGRPALPNAFIIERKDESMSYADILSQIKKDQALNDVGTSVQKVRRTKAGSLLFILKKESSERASELHKVMQTALGEKASVKSKVQELDIEIKDMDEVTTKEEVMEALQRDLGADSGITLQSVRSLRWAYSETQTAVVRMTTFIAKKLLDRKTIRIGWTYCRIRELVRPLKCFKCWDFGHLSRNCSSEVDRSKSCIKCGEEGHKVAVCKAIAHCVLCAAKGGKGPVNHIAGSSRCPAYTRAFQATAKRR